MITRHRRFADRTGLPRQMSKNKRRPSSKDPLSRLKNNAVHLQEDVGNAFADLVNSDFDTFFTEWDDKEEVEQLASEVSNIAVLAVDLSQYARKLEVLLDELLRKMP